METIFKFLSLCSLVSFSHLLGMYWSIDNFNEWWRAAGAVKKTMMCIWALAITVGWIHVLGWFIYFWFWVL